jgi:hypothetical protein
LIDDATSAFDRRKRLKAFRQCEMTRMSIFVIFCGAITTLLADGVEKGSWLVGFVLLGVFSATRLAATDPDATETMVRDLRQTLRAADLVVA